ncbi:anion exchange family protein [Aspergillus novofumigatus IBT 16806]|uniref:Bicarbonate transporter-like transmembrane domain-containing protein n=1 Tax=Aspergillus novofumigatus (strain IBT 16806) TaxID=1392255 RepID=A0A2I1C5I6_ASPN1|nr:uncharacterized protein P174DRAFT_461369 [Aspergillus novofumigatus IBT 16806]PKX92872.1 hypothetical protein P174DRAFT_461369 [Aspergillus novofumigatus IBT 16806]
MSSDQPLIREKSWLSYTYEGRKGWKSLRALNLFRAMYHDVRQRLPYYWTDITDAWTYRVVASTIRMYFVNMLPAIAYTLDMSRCTGGFYGINEALFSSALAAMIFSVFGAQPLTIVGITGLISPFGAYVGIIYCSNTMIAILYFLTVYGLERLGSSTIWKPWLRGLLADYAYVIGTIFWVGFLHIPGNFKATHVSFVLANRALCPTQPRGWLIHFWDLGPNRPPISSRRPSTPTPLTIYETSIRTISTSEGEGADIRRPIVPATTAVEQRISHFLMGLLIIGTMTHPLLSNGILQKLIFLARENRFIQRDESLLTVRRRKIVLYIACQAVGVAATVAISQTIAAIGFPILILALIPFRVWVMPRWFSAEELDVMDDLTVNNSAPRFPGQPDNERFGLERGYSEQRFGSARLRAGGIHR